MINQIICENFETYNTYELPIIETYPKIDEGC